MKIDIITLHYIWHYGSLLQTYATCKVFEKLGLETEVIDYVRPNASETEEIKAGIVAKGYEKKPVKKALLIISKKIENKRRRKFSEEFLRKKVSMTKRYSSFEELKTNPPIADIYCTGSDQTWNSEYNGGFLPAYFLEFAPAEKKRIGYAISIGMDEIPEKELEQTKNAVLKYSAISVREDSAVKLIKKLGYESVQQVLDPTLGLSLEDWKPLIAPDANNGKYILIYKLNPNDKLEEFAEKLAKEKKCKIIRVSYYLNHFKNQGKMKYSPSVEEFLSLIYNAESVITDSFHCVAFSLNFNKDFYAFYPGKYSTRISSILELTGTKHRAVGERDFSYDVINYEYVNEVLSKERKRTLDFLKESCR